MKKLLAIFTALLMAVTLVGCDSNDNGDDDEPDVENAQVRFVHASPDAGPVDVLVDGEEEATDFPYNPTTPSVSGYLDVPVDMDIDIEVRTQDGTIVNTVNTDQVDLDEDTRYTVIVAGRPGDVTGAPNESAPRAVLLEDQFTDLADDEIGLRLVHGSALAGPVDVYLVSSQGRTTLASNFQFGDDSGVGFSGQFVSRAVSNEAQTLEVYAAGTDPENNEPVLPLQIGGTGGLQVNPGQYITGIAVDAPGQQVPVSALVIAESDPDDN